MDGLPVTIRLIDPPLHEFLPRLEELIERVTREEVAPAQGGQVGGALDRDRPLLDAVRRIHEENPMLGLRGVRLGLVIPGLITMQVRAVAEAAHGFVARGWTHVPRSWSRWSRPPLSCSWCARRWRP